MINDSRRTFTENLKQHFNEQKRRLDVDRFKAAKKHERAAAAAKEMSEFSVSKGLEQRPYEEFYHLMRRKTKELGEIADLVVANMHAKEIKLAAFVQNGSGDLGEVTTRVCKAVDLIGGRAPEPVASSRGSVK